MVMFCRVLVEAQSKLLIKPWYSTDPMGSFKDDCPSAHTLKVDRYMRAHLLAIQLILFYYSIGKPDRLLSNVHQCSAI
jgi:hypothetical protein